MAAPRIGIDVTSALTQGGGIGRYTRELIRALAPLDSGKQYTFFSARVTENTPVPDPLPAGSAITYRPSPLSERWLYRIWYRLRFPLPVQLSTGTLDLFHSPDFVLPPVSSNIPTLLTVHDLSFVHYPDTFPETLVRYLNGVVPWSVRRATHVLADSQSTKNDLVSLWHVPQDKITVLYSGVSDAYRPILDDTLVNRVRHTYGLGDRPYILSVGTVQPRKNYGMLIKAFAPVARQFPHVLAIAGGKGWLESEMMAEAQRQGIADRVLFLGFVADEDLPGLYNGSDLFAFPSLYEGFGLPVLEAMACGVPTLVSDRSSLPEVAGDAAIQLSPDDPEIWSTNLLSLLADGDSRRQRGAAGIHHAQNFSWERSARRLLMVYDMLLDKA